MNFFRQGDYETISSEDFGFSEFYRNTRWAVAFNKLRNMLSQQDDIDADFVVSPDTQTVVALMGYLHYLRTSDLLPPRHITIGPDGEILVTWIDGSLLLELESEEPGVFDYMYRIKGQDPKFYTVRSPVIQKDFFSWNSLSDYQGVRCFFNADISTFSQDEFCSVNPLSNYRERQYLSDDYDPVGSYPFTDNSESAEAAG